ATLERDLHARAIGGVTHGIPHDVFDGAPDQVGVAIDQTVPLTGYRDDAPACPCFVVGIHGDFIDKCGDVEDAPSLEADAAVDPRHRQKLSNQCVQPFRFDLCAIEVFADTRSAVTAREAERDIQARQ